MIHRRDAGVDLPASSGAHIGRKRRQDIGRGGNGLKIWVVEGPRNVGDAMETWSCFAGRAGDLRQLPKSFSDSGK